MRRRRSFRSRRWLTTLTALAGVAAIAVAAGVTGIVTSVSSTHGACEGNDGSLDSFSCNLGTLQPGETAFITVDALPDEPGNLMNTAQAMGSLHDPNPGNNQDMAMALVKPKKPKKADLAVSKSDSPDPAKLEQPLTYSISVVNNGPADASGVTLTDLLPVGVVLDSVTSSQGSCGPSASGISCDLGDLAAGAGASVQIEVTPTAVGFLRNKVTVHGDQPDPDGTNNMDSTLTEVVPHSADVRVNKDVDQHAIEAGQSIQFTISVTNDGPDATDVTLDDQLLLVGN